MDEELDGSKSASAAPIPSRGLMNASANNLQADSRAAFAQAARKRVSAAEASSAEKSAVANDDAGAVSDSSQSPRLSDGHHPVSLPWQAPLYLCPNVRLASMESVGGGRGYVAHFETSGAALPAGTLVMLEEPLLEWPVEQIGRELGLVSVRHIVENFGATRLHELEHLHPTKAAVDSIDYNKNKETSRDGEGEFEEQVVQMMLHLCERHVNDPMLQDIVVTAEKRGLVNSNGTPFEATDCLRLLLALRYNGLQSGMYLHVAMLNHSDQPNCVKFMPDSGRSQRDGRRGGGSKDGKRPLVFSEVRTTRSVRNGEALTIRYVPSIRSHATRRHDLWEQHRFDIGNNVSKSLHEMELVHGELPKSSLDRPNDSAVASQVEAATDDLQKLYQDTLESLPSGPIQLSIGSTAGAISNKALAVIEQIRMLESASDELVSSARERLANHRHVLLIPCLELHLDCSNLVLRHDATLKPVHRAQLLCRTVRTAMRLVELQTDFHGPDHYDLARTCLDLAQSIEELLSLSPQTLFVLGRDFPATPPLTTVAAWSAREHRARKEHNRIKDLYPRDVDDFFS